ncbi:DUF6412 domain-containing protein [Streptomyces sp. NPDC058045]|uniref:DUF6412 domain-containing protein n=1 Tax=Streptomyces sp. NPDC058045 TaxID=3346311 RepID=UPI0036E0CE57
MVRSRLPLRSLALLLLVLGQLLLVDSGSLPTAVALTATAVAATLLAACALLAAGRAPAVPTHRVRTALRDRARRTAFLPQRDPDAAGRPRPRAPGRPLPTTA